MSLLVLIIILVGLNAASYTQKEEGVEREINPNRSTYNAGATGTRAFFEFLQETGRKPVRWQKPLAAISTEDKTRPQVFVIIGPLRREFDENEAEQLLQWIAGGGKLIVIDREPQKSFANQTARWAISFHESNVRPLFETDPADQKQMITGAAAAKPAQPTIYTDKINAVQASRFASSIDLEYRNDIKETSVASNDSAEAVSANSALTAPVVHLSNKDKNFLVEVPFGSGRILFLSDPYIISNGGINLVDNLKLAVNLVDSGDGGITAFDEYHHGYGANNNPLLTYFAGTPLTALFLQFAVLIGSILFTASRRFARPLPADEPDRLSKLEYVAAMAQLQQRTKAYDLAIDNIYTDFHRRAARALGVDNFKTSISKMAEIIAERTDLEAGSVADTMSKCEAVVRGKAAGKREIIRLVKHLREIEFGLGLQRNRRK